MPALPSPPRRRRLPSGVHIARVASLAPPPALRAHHHPVQLLALGSCNREWRRLTADQRLWQALAQRDFTRAAFAPSYPSWKAAYRGALESLRPRNDFLLLNYGRTGPVFPPKRAAAVREP